MTTHPGGRRSFLRAAMGRLVDTFTTQATRRVAPRGRFLRPPGALPELEFLTACTRCDACLEACPPGAIVHAPARAGFAARTPVIEPRSQPCTVCPDMPCAQACPTEALTVPDGGWREAKLGWVELIPERCIAFDDVTCGICARSCPVGEAALRLDDRGRPVILQEGCVGCGACERACVTAPPSIVVHPREAM